MDLEQARTRILGDPSGIRGMDDGGDSPAVELDRSLGILHDRSDARRLLRRIENECILIGSACMVMAAPPM